MSPRITVFTTAAIWLLAGGALFDQTYGWWAGVEPVVRLPVHTDAIYVFAAVLVWGVVVLLANLYRAATRGATTWHWLHAAMLSAGLLAPWIPADYTNAVTVRVLGPGRRGDVLLINTASAGRTSVVVALLDAGVPPDPRIPGVDTALHYAAARDHVDVIKVLIDRGANVNAIGPHGLTPLHLAEEGKNREAIGVLTAHGARQW